MVMKTSGDISQLFQRLTPHPAKLPLKDAAPFRPVPVQAVAPAAVTHLGVEDGFAVGLEVARTDLGDRTTDEADSCGSPLFVSAIMHRVVDARCFVATVRYSASSKEIAEACEVEEGDVEDVWLCGVRTPPVGYGKEVGKGCTMRFTPQSVLDTDALEDGCQVWGENLDGNVFRELFEGGKNVDEDVVRFGYALIERLQRLGGRVEGPESGKSVRRRGMGRVGGCGFSEEGTHVDVEVLCGGLGICKTGGGLYRTARSCGKLREGSNYFEVVVVEDCDAGGICVGVAGEGMMLNKLVGSVGGSCGMHSSGQIVSKGGEFCNFGKAFRRGDRVGCLANVRRRDDEQGVSVQLEYWVNGQHQGKVEEQLWDGLCDEDVYAAVSLYKKGSKAVMRCCRKDWVMGVNEAQALCQH